ncbi:hypothetical protein C8R43DRAFT_892910 [Mycena crocata]|nr:hypothetical protein C8R43DRAFT_892910 [Mycena crocata]
MVIARLRARWRSPVYSFYKPTVTIGYDKGRKYHFFYCTNPKCRNGKNGGIRRYLDKKDLSSTGNLLGHARVCHGSAAVEAVMRGDEPKAGRRDGSIYAAFARIGSRVKSFSYRPHSKTETRAHIVRWIAESNRPAKIVSDDGFENLMKTGRPGTTLPSPRQVGRDVITAHLMSREKMKRLLQEYQGNLSFCTDAWTSPNHRAIVAFTVHLQHEGTPLQFILDTCEIPEVSCHDAYLSYC